MTDEQHEHNQKILADLETAFGGVAQIWRQVGSVKVEPDYDASIPNVSELAELTSEFTLCLKNQSPPAKLSPQGWEAQIGSDAIVLRKYADRITLHEEPSSPWVQVLPWGSWA